MNPAADIASLIPHAGRMCLLDGVVMWDKERLSARASGHREAGNPLRRNGRLGVLAGIEYAAQAMAAHGRLTGAVSARPRMGFLIGLRDVVCHVEFIDELPDMIVTVERQMGDEDRVIYGFRISGGDAPVIEGRATVILRGDEA